MDDSNKIHSIFGRAEVELAYRNHGGFTEGLKRDITPAGMHYLLIHYDIPQIDIQNYRLVLSGLVKRPLELTIDQIRARKRHTVAVTLECAGNGRSNMAPRRQSVPWNDQAFGTAEWTGCRLKDLLNDVGCDPETLEILFTGADKGVEDSQIQYYQRSLSLAEATLDNVLLAYEMNGQPLLPQHGYPLRLIVPDWYGMASVKWLTKIEAISYQFNGYQMGAYSFFKSYSEPPSVAARVTTQRVKCLMAPPGIPDFFSRTRIVELGKQTITGRAWAGKNQVVKVEVSVDGGTSWQDALLNPAGSRDLGKHAWKKFVFEWNATRAGQYTVCARATDSAGNIQPWQAEFNVRGFANNSIQRIPVLAVDNLLPGEQLIIQEETFKPLPVTEAKL